MRLFICYASNNKTQSDFVGHQQVALIPRTLLDRDFIKEQNFSFSVGIYTGKDGSLENYLHKRGSHVDAICLLLDSKTLPINISVRVACFVAEIDIGVAPLNYKNSFARQFSKILSNFAVFASIIRDADNLQAMCLPLRNFKATELLALAESFEQGTTGNDFPRDIPSNVAKLRKMRHPMPNRDPNEKYFVDTDDKYFSYGHETHSSISAGNGHSDLCVLSGNFRFGWKIPNNRHYNMQKPDGDKTSIAGEFEGCHGQVESVPRQKHVNIFASDFMEYKQK